ncbi:MAG TPA: homoserine dehydrogenase [Roseiflexaceae bacterium]|nr:homoserine dehydrogenase [Roseiflexaceae bacterium]
MNITRHRVIVAGLGNVGRSLLEILQSQAELLRERYGVAFVLVGAADSSGAALDPDGLDIAAVLAAKAAGNGVATLPEVGKPGMGGIDLARGLEADLLLEATPVNLQTGQPGLDIVRTALGRGMPVVLANKGPLALAYQELAALSDLAHDQELLRQANKQIGDPDTTVVVSRSPALRFSACCGGAMPTINIGWRDLVGCRIERVEAVLNGTTQGILRAMEGGGEYADALAEMQRRGIAETDPTLDVEGWDAANKLVILANAVLGRPTTLADLEVEGIANVTSAELREALAHRSRLVLLGLAEWIEGDYRLSVRPTALPLDHPLARMSGDEMGVVYHTDIAGRQSATTLERGPVPTAAAMLRDMIEIVVHQ